MVRMPPFARIQERYGDIAGERGIALRRKHYAPYFLRMGRDVVIEEGCRFYHPNRIMLEDGVRINIGALIYGSGGVRIGRHGRIGPRCFIHSANHDISIAALPFSNPRYMDAAVSIGDHALLSANVSVLPGAQLGAHSFAACGAVIAGKVYNDHARLKGVPARVEYPALPDAPAPKPSIVILAHVKDDWLAIAKHLVVSLGLPQVQVLSDGETLPESAHSVMLFGPADWQPPVGGRRVWRLADGTVPIADATLPTMRPAHVVMRDSTLAEAAFWLDTRLTKGAGRLSQSDYDGWNITMALLSLADSRADGLKERWQKTIYKRRPRAKWLRFRPALSSAALTTKAVLAQPELLVRAVMQHILPPDQLRALLTTCLDLPLTGTRLVAYAISAHLLKEPALVARIETLLGTDVFPIQTATKTTRCYSPLVLAWHYIKSGLPALPDYCGQVRDKSRAMNWHGFANQQLWDEVTQSVARDLVTHWYSLHTLTLTQHAHFVLKDASYDVSLGELTERWRRVFRTIHHAANEAQIVLNPWPAGYDAALSLRYDVDRPVSGGTISNLVGLQMRALGAPCASWYYFPKHPDRAAQAGYLKRHWQETALHLERDDSAEMAVGVTHHSAPTSHYWQGDRTGATLSEKRASYGEWLSVNLHTPRPSLAHPDLWLTPLHFPLEASTHDTSLAYFKRLLPQLRAVLASRGHVILGSHPDLNQDLMRRALRSIFSPSVWCAPVNEVVERMKALHMCGNIVVTRCEEGVALYSKHSISDVVIDIYDVGSATPRRSVFQLISHLCVPLKV
jgi:acetyltransferase-like isoleucine patch superfamily enzyme